VVGHRWIIGYDCRDDTLWDFGYVFGELHRGVLGLPLSLSKISTALILGTLIDFCL